MEAKPVQRRQYMTVLLAAEQRKSMHSAGDVFKMKCIDTKKVRVALPTGGQSDVLVPSPPAARGQDFVCVLNTRDCQFWGTFLSGLQVSLCHTSPSVSVVHM
jgi:hypothetical protein